MGTSSWVLAVVFTTILLPSAWSLQVAGLRFTVYRVVLIAIAPVAIYRLFASGRAFACDWLILCGFAWASVSATVFYGPEISLESVGILTLEGFGAYCIARGWRWNRRQLQEFLAILAPILSIYSVFCILESLLHFPFLAKTLAPWWQLPSIDTRLGMRRAIGTMDHPILLGIVGGVILGIGLAALAFRVSRLLSVLMTSAGAIMVFSSVSSGASMILFVTAAGLGWLAIAGSYPRKWSLLGALLFGMYLVVELASNRDAITVMLSYLTFSPGTAFNRQLIWEWGFWHNLVPNPVFGIGLFEDWVRLPWMRSGSMDNFWLYWGVRFGVPAVVSLLLGVVLVLRRLTARADADSASLVALASPFNRLAASLTALILAAATVHLWNAAFVVFWLFVGMAALLAIEGVNPEDCRSWRSRQPRPPFQSPPGS